jgi:hypothetical protein
MPEFHLSVCSSQAVSRQLRFFCSPRKLHLPSNHRRRLFTSFNPAKASVVIRENEDLVFDQPSGSETPASFIDQKREGRQRVVILGSGWAGYTLCRRLDHKKYQVVIVSPRSYFVFTPLLASTAVGTLEFRTALEPIRNRRNKASYVQGWGYDVDLYNKTITIEEAIADPSQSLALTSSRHEGKDEAALQLEKASKTKKGQLFDLKYDKLIIAVGAYTQTFNTPGVKENANFLKDVGDARKIRKRLLECFETASLPTTPDAVRKQLLHFAIVGGGPTGIEFSAEFVSPNIRPSASTHTAPDYTTSSTRTWRASTRTSHSQRSRSTTSLQRFLPNSMINSPSTPQTCSSAAASTFVPLAESLS